MKTLASTQLVLITAFMLGGCPGIGAGNGDGEGDGQPISGGKLLAFQSSDEWIGYFRDQARERFVRNARNGGLFDYFALGGSGGATATAESSPAEGPAIDRATDDGNFSTTNVQEAGVDEADVVKSDGTNLYIAKGRSLRVVHASPRGEMAEIGRLGLEKPIQDFYLLDGHIITLTQSYGGSYGAADILIWPPYYSGGETILTDISISDPANPSILATTEMDGSLVSSRVTNGRLVLVLSISPRIPENPTAENIDAIAFEEVMPKMRTFYGETDLVPWENWLYPESPDGYEMTAVVAINQDNIQETVGSVAIMARAGTIYANTKSLYVSDASYDYASNARVTTTLHKFSFDDNGAALYVSSGTVPGRLLNQFSLGEHNDALRVAMHIEPEFRIFEDAPVSSDGNVVTQAEAPLPNVASNAVYVLRDNAGSLDIVGKIEGIAPNETLYSARFMGDHGFVVTFRRVDPLFVLDLTDDANPRIAGELKIPGFSDYLHPLDDTHLIGVGKATTTTADGFDLLRGVQVSLFDVSDWNNPRVVQQIELGGRGSSSDVNYTHKAFTILEDRGLIALPVQLYTGSDQPWEYGELAFQGVIAFQVDPAAGFTELGRIASVTRSSGPYGTFYEPWGRAAFIGETLYAINGTGVRAADLTDFNATTTVTLAPGGEDFDPYAGSIEGDVATGSPGR